MVEENNFEFSSSQESLVLSQETFDYIWKEFVVTPMNNGNHDFDNLASGSEMQPTAPEIKEEYMPSRKRSNLSRITRAAKRKRELRRAAAAVLAGHKAYHPAYKVRPGTSNRRVHHLVQQRLDSSDLNVINELASRPYVTDLEIQSQAVTPSADLQSSACVSTQHVPSSLPASQTWPGEHDFTVSFGPQKKDTKGVSWTYSKVVDKLYVGKDTPCPINFSANTHLPHGVKIRVMALYTSPEQAHEVVKRCINHSMEECSKGIFEAEHLVRCESVMAVYKRDESTGRHSVIVPFENPPVGQQYSTYIFKFACFGSCAGGPNRRPLMLIFTLEKDNQVLGRKKLDVKICACPGRDRKTEEAQHVELDVKHGNLKRKESSPSLVNLSDTLSFTKSITYPASKKSKTVSDKNGFYTVYADSKDCYEFLLQMKKFYEICKIMEGLSPDITKALLNYQKKKSNDKSE